MIYHRGGRSIFPKKSATITQGHDKDPDVLTASFSPIRNPSCYASTAQPSHVSHIGFPSSASQARESSLAHH